MNSEKRNHFISAVYELYDGYLANEEDQTHEQILQKMWAGCLIDREELEELHEYFNQ